ncbi:MAG: acyloxyacyl hydrolase [Candidatus Krumholzibacteria bacterium]|nr:acyloxyacyl hydrolase [Candidatus Krumholzibacteria bacterium]
MVSLWLGVSYDSPADQFLGVTPGRDFHEFAFRMGWRLVDARLLRLDYTLDLIPLAMITNNPRYSIGATTFNGMRQRRITDYETEYGIGAAPFGLRVGVPLLTRWFVFASGSAGFLAFEGRVPTYGASYFNFTFDFGGGVEASITNRWGIYAGYKLHHLSNGGRAYENPGIDSNIFYLGATGSY